MNYFIIIISGSKAIKKSYYVSFRAFCAKQKQIYSMIYFIHVKNKVNDLQTNISSEYFRT